MKRWGSSLGSPAALGLLILYTVLVGLYTLHRDTARGATQVEVIRVPGSFEVPVVAARLVTAPSPAFDAVINTSMP